MKFTGYLKKNLAEVLFIGLAASLPFLLINKVQIALLVSLFLLALTVLFLYFRFRETKKRDKEQASLCFFASLMEGLEKGYGFAQSYESSSKYLMGHYPILPVDELLEHPDSTNIDLGKYNPYFRYLLSMEIQNESHLKNYRMLIEEVEKDIEALTSDMSRHLRYHQTCLVSVVAFFVLVGVLLSINTTLANALLNDSFLAVESIVLASVFPLMELSSYRKVKGESHVIQA